MGHTGYSYWILTSRLHQNGLVMFIQSIHASNHHNSFFFPVHINHPIALSSQPSNMFEVHYFTTSDVIHGVSTHPTQTRFRTNSWLEENYHVTSHAHFVWPSTGRKPCWYLDCCKVSFPPLNVSFNQSTDTTDFGKLFVRSQSLRKCNPETKIYQYIY